MDTSTHVMVLEALQRASSQNAEILKPAEEKLREWEIQPGFYSALLNVFLDYSIDTTVRFQATVYLKNGIDKYWRKNAPNAITEDEKQHIKQCMLNNFNEPVNQIALQKALTIAKIARIDCPNEWPQLLPTLVQAIENHPDPLVQHRALMTFHQVVKSLASRRFSHEKRMFREFTDTIYMFVFNLWNTFTETYFRDVMQNAGNEIIMPNMEKSLFCLRVLRKLTVFGFYKPSSSENCMGFLKMIFERIRTCLQCRKQLITKGDIITELCEKYIAQLMKVLLEVLDTHPFSFIDLIQPSFELCMFYIFTLDGANLVFERFVIQCFNLLGSILLCAEYKTSKVVHLTKNPETLRAYHIKMNFFQPEVLTDITRKLVSHYFLLNQEELENWEADPEGYVLSNDGSSENWKYNLRPGIETVFVTIFHEFKEILAPVLLEMIRETNCLVDPEDMARILQKDAVYNALGLAAYDLYDDVDFDQLFTTMLVEELKVEHFNYKIIKRRAMSLTGKWIGVKMSQNCRPLLYKCIVHLLRHEEDLVVRLTAASTLRYAIDDFDFDTQQFKDYIDVTFNMLFDLLKHAQECETKMHMLTIIALMVERVGQAIQPQSDALVHYLPLLWREADDHDMLRCAIVSTLVQLVKALGAVSSELNPFLLPVIQFGTDTNQKAIVYLLEDCLDLWVTVLENSAFMTNELMQLFNNMPALLEYSSENLRLCMLIVLAHMLLAPELVMRTHGHQVMEICDSLMSDMRSEGIIMLSRLVETFIRASPVLGAETAMPVLPRILRAVCEGEEYPLVMTMYLVVMARVLLASHQIFTTVLGRVAQTENETDQCVLKMFLGIWLNKMRNVSQLDHRKVLGLALTNLLTVYSRPVIERFSDVMLNILECLNDITKFDDNGVPIDSLVLGPNDDDDEANEYETHHDRRKKQLLLNDPVHTIVLKDYLQSQLIKLKNQIGMPQYEQLLQTIDADTLSQLKDYVTF